MQMDKKNAVERGQGHLQNREQAKRVFGRRRAVSAPMRALRYLTREKSQRARRRAVMEAFRKWGHSGA